MREPTDCDVVGVYLRAEFPPAVLLGLGTDDVRLPVAFVALCPQSARDVAAQLLVQATACEQAVDDYIEAQRAAIG
jgi:hypothetical protein